MQCAKLICQVGGVLLRETANHSLQLLNQFYN